MSNEYENLKRQKTAMELKKLNKIIDSYNEILRAKLAELSGTNGLTVEDIQTIIEYLGIEDKQ